MIAKRRPGSMPFVTVTNALVNDRRVTSALGVLIYLLSKPDDWVVRKGELRDRFGVGDHVIQGWMRQLREAGYAVLEPLKSPTGAFIGKGYLISAEPMETPDLSTDEDEGEPVAGDDPEASETVETSDAKEASSGSGQANNWPVHGQANFPSVQKLPRPLQKKDNIQKPPLSPESDFDGAPSSASMGAGASSEIEQLPADIETDWTRFQTLWPFGEGEDRAKARRRMARMSSAQRSEALRGIEGYLTWCRRNERKRANAASYLRDEKWVSIHAAAPSPQIFVRTGTPAFEAWADQWRREKKMPAGMKPFTVWHAGDDGVKREGVWKPSLFPPRATGDPAAPATGQDADQRKSA